jgi:5-methylcytosine-specific restriction endonuclease McrA
MGREPSAGRHKMVGQDVRRDFYDHYITSDRWRARREAWAAWQRERLSGEPIRCYSCREVWALERDDLHHCDYDRLGAEANEDLWPLCRPCHENLHQLLRLFPSYRRMPRRQANTLALGALSTDFGDDGLTALRDAL